jgi:Mce-associated membrane protein
VVQTAVLRSVGLVSMRGSTAEVLVVADVVIRWEGREEPPQERFYRWKMQVAKVGGAWLVAKEEQIL